MNKIYAIHTGRVKSKYDEDIHFINMPQLMKCYNVNPDYCFLWIRSCDYFKNPENYYHLYPDSTGEYSLPMEKGYAFK